MSANGGSQANLVEATLIRKAYLGDLVNYQVLAPGGRELALQRQNDPGDAAATWEVGQRVTVTWDPSSALILEADNTVIDADEMRLVSDTDKPA